MTEQSAKQHASRYVRQMEQRGYTSANAKRETCLGYGAPGEPGYMIHSGKISVPGAGSDKFTWQFTEIEKMGQGPEQMEFTL